MSKPSHRPLAADRRKPREWRPGVHTQAGCWQPAAVGIDRVYSRAFPLPVAARRPWRSLRTTTCILFTDLQQRI